MFVFPHLLLHFKTVRGRQVDPQIVCVCMSVYNIITSRYEVCDLENRLKVGRGDIARLLPRFAGIRSLNYDYCILYRIIHNNIIINDITIKVPEASSLYTRMYGKNQKCIIIILVHFISTWQIIIYINITYYRGIIILWARVDFVKLYDLESIETAWHCHKYYNVPTYYYFIKMRKMKSKEDEYYYYYVVAVPMYCTHFFHLKKRKISYKNNANAHAYRYTER